MTLLEQATYATADRSSSKARGTDTEGCPQNPRLTPRAVRRNQSTTIDTPWLLSFELWKRGSRWCASQPPFTLNREENLYKDLGATQKRRPTGVRRWDRSGDGSGASYIPANLRSHIWPRSKRSRWLKVYPRHPQLTPTSQASLVFQRDQRHLWFQFDLMEKIQQTQTHQTRRRDEKRRQGVETERLDRSTSPVVTGDEASATTTRKSLLKIANRVWRRGIGRDSRENIFSLSLLIL